MDYQRFVEEGGDPKGGFDLEGGGWIPRSIPECEDGLARIRRDDEIHDGRVLGRAEFIQRVLDATHSSPVVEKVKMPLPDLITRVSEWCKVEVEDLFLGRRTREVSGARAIISYLAVQKMGYRFSEVGESLKVHPASVARSLEKGKEICAGNREASPISVMALGPGCHNPVHEDWR
jgi:chromosomal replication initiation ATPase DnaA